VRGMGAKGRRRGSVAARGEDIDKAEGDGRRWGRARGAGAGARGGEERGASKECGSCSPRTGTRRVASWGAALPAFIGARHTPVTPATAHQITRVRAAHMVTTRDASPHPHKRNGSSHHRNFPLRPSYTRIRTKNPSLPHT
jgi:hypothetical protein